MSRDKSTSAYDPDTLHKISSLDILATFKGPKAHLHGGATLHYSQTKLPDVACDFLVGAMLGIFASFGEVPQGSLIVAGINALIAFTLAIINYLKLDAQSEAHKYQPISMTLLPNGV